MSPASLRLRKMSPASLRLRMRASFIELPSISNARRSCYTQLTVPIVLDPDGIAVTCAFFYEVSSTVPLNFSALLFFIATIR